MITIESIALHELVKNEDGELQLHLSTDTLHRDVKVESLVHQINDFFVSKTGKGFGSFDQELSSAYYCMDAFLQGEYDFMRTTSKLAQNLRDELVKWPFADSGVLVFAQYVCHSHRYLFIGLVPKVTSLTADAELSIAPVDYLDVKSMTIAVRFDFNQIASAPDNGSGTYISFLHTGNKRRMNEFFVGFLGISVAPESKHHNLVLVQAVEDYLNDSSVGCDEDDRSLLIRGAHAYCDGQIKLKDDISINELSDAISDGMNQNFNEYVEAMGYMLDETFQGDRGALKRLVKIAGNGGGISLSFDAQLLSERVFYDADTDILTIKGTPPAVRDQLIRKAKHQK